MGGIMKKLRIIAECKLTEKEAKKILKRRAIVWDVDKPIASVMGKDIKFVSVSIVEE